MLRENYRNSMLLPGGCNNLIPDICTGKPALLILDMQKYFLCPESHAFVPSAPELIPCILQLAEVFQRMNLPVVFTRHLNTSLNSGMMGRWWNEVITAENPESEIHSAFNTSEATVLKKTQYDAFFRTGLDKLLKKQGVSTVVVTGVMTNLCCETTARSAFVRGYRVLMPVDGTATMNRELHLATTANLAHGFANPVSISAILSSLGRSYGN
jgi:bifunctional isochorismate lyase/aryl carrier protein